MTITYIPFGRLLQMLSIFAQVVEFLLKAGADVTHQAEGEVTAVTLADQNGHQDIVELLQRQGGKLVKTAPAQQSWGGYFKDMLGKAWGQSIRSLQLTMPEEGEEAIKGVNRARRSRPPVPISNKAVMAGTIKRIEKV